MSDKSDSWESVDRLVTKYQHEEDIKYQHEEDIFVHLLLPGERIVAAFLGDPFARETVWDGERYVNHNPAIHHDARYTLRVAINLYLPSDMNFGLPRCGAMKVMEGDTTWFKSVLRIREKYGLCKQMFAIKMTDAGAGDPTSGPDFRYSIFPERNIRDADLANISNLKMHDLAELALRHELRPRLCAGDATVRE